jgi:hypothetical protein
METLASREDVKFIISILDGSADSYLLLKQQLNYIQLEIINLHFN